MNRNIDAEGESRRTFIAKILNAVTGVFGLVFFALVVGANGLGTYYTIISILTIYKSLVFGIGTGIEHKISLDGSSLKNSQFSIVGIISSLVLSLLVTCIILFAYYTIGLHQTDKSNIIVYIISIFILVSSMEAVTSRCYVGFGNPSSEMFISAGVGLLQTFFQIILILQVGNDVIALLLGSLLASFFGTVYLLINLPLTIVKPDLTQFKELYNYIKWSATSRTIESINNKSPTLMIAVILGPTAVGIYEVCVRVTSVAGYPAESIRSVIVVGAGQSNKESSVLKSLGNYASFLSVPLIFGCIVVGTDLLKLLSSGSGEFTRGYIVIIGCAIYVSVKCHSLVLSGYLNGTGHPDIPTKSVVISTVFIICSGFISINYIGLNGVIIPLIGGEILRLVTMYFLGASVETNYIPEKVLNQIYASIYMLVITAIVYVLGINLGITIRFGITVISGVFTYLVAMYFLDTKFKSYAEQYIPLSTSHE